MIVVARDTEGLRLVLDEMFERGHDLTRLRPMMQGKDKDTAARMLASATPVTLSPGYGRWAAHLLLLERMKNLGIALGDLLATEVAGLQVIEEARSAHKSKHPPCGACGAAQDNRFQTECVDCGAKFRRRGGK